MLFKNHNEIHFILIRIARIKKSDNIKRWGGCEKLEVPYTAGENVKWCSHFGKHSSSS